MMTRLGDRPWIGVVALLLSWGTARADLVTSPDNEFRMRSPRQLVEANFQVGETSGPRIGLVRQRSEILGSAFGQPVSLTWSDDRVEGLVGGAPVKMRILRDRQELRLSGIFAGQASDLVIGPREIKGLIKGCRYLLNSVGDHYEGWRTCGGPLPMPVRLEIPRDLSQRADPEVAAWVALLLHYE